MPRLSRFRSQVHERLQPWRRQFAAALGLALAALLASAGAAAAQTLYVGGVSVGFAGTFHASAAAIDTRTNALAPSLADAGPLLGGSATIRGFAIPPDGKRAYFVGSSDVDGVLTFDTTTNQPPSGSPIALSGSADPTDIAISPDGRRAYVARGELISVIDLQNGAEVAGSPIVLPASACPQIDLSARALAIAITPDGKRAYVADEESDCVFAIDTETNTLSGAPIDLDPTTATHAFPDAIAITPDGSRAYVVSASARTLTAIDTGTNAVVGAPIGVGGEAEAIAITPDGASAYVVDREDRDVTAIDLRAHRDLGTIAVGVEPKDVAFSADGKRAYVVNEGSRDVTVIDTATRQALPGGPIALDPSLLVPDTLAIAPDQGPTAALSAPAQVRLSSRLALDASASRDPDGTVARFDWDFGDGSSAQDAGPTPGHTYRAPGTYTVTVTATDEEGCSSALIYTGRTAYCNGSGAARASARVEVLPDKPTLRLGRLVLDRKHGTARLHVEVSLAGRLSLRGKGLVAQGRRVGAGRAVLRLKPTARLRAVLERAGKAKVRIRVGFKALDAPPLRASRAITLRLAAGR